MLSGVGYDTLKAVGVPSMVALPVDSLPALNVVPLISNVVNRFWYELIVIAPPSAVLGRTDVSEGNVMVNVSPAVT
jgi:hypothetical protein